MPVSRNHFRSNDETEAIFYSPSQAHHREEKRSSTLLLMQPRKGSPSAARDVTKQQFQQAASWKWIRMRFQINDLPSHNDDDDDGSVFRGLRLVTKDEWFLALDICVQLVPKGYIKSSFVGEQHSKVARNNSNNKKKNGKTRVQSTEWISESINFVK